MEALSNLAEAAVVQMTAFLQLNNAIAKSLQGVAMQCSDVFCVRDRCSYPRRAQHIRMRGLGHIV